MEDGRGCLENVSVSDKQFIISINEVLLFVVIIIIIINNLLKFLITITSNIFPKIL